MSSPAPSRIASLDLLRALAILAVVLFHCPFLEGMPAALQRLAGWGALGVDLFFVLSGFLIADQWFGQFQRDPANAKIGRFYLRRCFRIWPAYFAVLGAFALFPGVFGEKLEPFWKYLTLTQNFGLLSGFGVSWSLCVEEHFYLLFPWVAAGLLKWRSRRLSVTVFAGVILAGIAVRAGLWFSFRPDQVALVSLEQAQELHYRLFYFPTWARMDGLAIGVALAALKRFDPSRWSRLTGMGNRLLVAAFGAAFLAVLVGSHAFQGWLPLAWSAPGSPAGFSFPARAFGSLLWAGAFGLLVAAALSAGSLLSRLRIPGSTGLALLSYSIYLTHDVAYDFTDWLLRAGALPRSAALAIPMSFCLILGLGAALYVGVERPFLRLRDRFWADSTRGAGKNLHLAPLRVPR